MVVSFAPEHSCVEAVAGLGVAAVAVGVPLPVPVVGVVVALVGLHWNVVLCDFNGASERLNDVWSGSK